MVVCEKCVVAGRASKVNDGLGMRRAKLDIACVHIVARMRGKLADRKTRNWPAPMAGDMLLGTFAPFHITFPYLLKRILIHTENGARVPKSMSPAIWTGLFLVFRHFDVGAPSAL